MFLSIYPATQNSTGDAIAGVIVLLLMAIVWGVRKSPHKLSPFAMVFALFLCLVHYLFPQTGGDFNAYKEWVEMSGYTNTQILSMYHLHFERIYYDIINLVHNDYFLFRLIVWGGSLLLFCLTAMRLKLDASTFIFFLGINIVPMTSTSRVCLAYAIAFLGFSYMAKPIIRKGSDLMSLSIGAIIIVGSLFFHRSALFLIPVLALSLFQFNKKTLILLLLAFPVVVVILNTNLMEFLTSNIQNDDSMVDSETAMSYIGQDKKVFGIGHLIRLALSYISRFSIGFLIIKCILNKSYANWPKHIQKYANATIAVLFVASTFLFVNENTYKIFERLTSFSVIPQCILLTYLLKIDFEKKLVGRIIQLIAAYVAYNIIYDQIYLGGSI